MEKDNENDDSRKNIEILKDLQQSEATLHWQRNGFFLLASSILLVAVGQFHTNLIGLSFGILGLMMNSVWLLIQYRSSEYIKKWKSKEKEQEKKLKAPPDLYSGEVRGYEMRRLAILLPLPFIMIWGVVFALSIYGIVNHVNMIPISASSLNSTLP